MCVLCAVGLARSSQSTRAVTHASPTHVLALYPDVHTPRSPAPQRAAPQWLHPSPKNSVSGRLTLLSACIAQALDTLHKCDSHKIGNVLACHGRVREANLKPTWQPPGPVPACPRGLPTAGDAVQRSACVHAVLPKCMCCLLACLRACVRGRSVSGFACTNQQAGVRGEEGLPTAAVAATGNPGRSWAVLAAPTTGACSCCVCFACRLIASREALVASRRAAQRSPCSRRQAGTGTGSLSADGFG